MATEAQILSSLSPNVIVGDPVGPLVRNQWKNLRSFEYFLCKTNPISEMAKMNANAFSQKDYENETAFRLQKTNPISKQL